MAGTRASSAASQAAVQLANQRAGETAYHSAMVRAGGQLLHAVIAGQGPAIVLVHGFPSFWYCWIRQMEALRHRFRLIALDMPGAGASPPPGEDGYRVPQLAAVLGEAIDALAGSEAAVLVGHDWGAALTLAYAQARPVRLRAVTGIAAPPFNMVLRLLRNDPDQRRRSAYMAELRTMTAKRARAIAAEQVRNAYAGLLDRGEIDQAEADLFAAACGDPAAFLAGCSWYGANLDGPPWPSDDRPLAMPATLIWGDADETFVPDAPARFAAHHAGARVCSIPGAGHWCMIQSPAEVNAVLAELAAALPAAGAAA